MNGLRQIRLSYYLCCLIAVTLLLALIPSIVSAKTYHIRVGEEGFEPDTLTIEVGDTVVWTHKSANANVLESGDDSGGTCTETFNYIFMSPGETFSRTFTKEGPCYYICRLHGSGMNGVIHVKPKSDTTTTTIQG